MQMDLVQYKVLHTTFELTRIRICMSVQVVKHLEIGLNLENGVLSYSMWKLVTTRWCLFATPDYLAEEPITNNNNIAKIKKVNLALLAITQLFGGLTFSLLSPFYTEEATQKGTIHIFEKMQKQSGKSLLFGTY